MRIHFGLYLLMLGALSQAQEPSDSTRQQVDRLKQAVNEAVVRGDRARIDQYNQRITDLLSDYPQWVQQKTRDASALPGTGELDSAREDWLKMTREFNAQYQQGAYDSCLTLAQRRLQQARREFGGSHPYTWTSINDLAVIHQLHKRFDLAEPLLKENLEQRKNALGEKHPHSLISLNNLATFYEAGNDYQQARSLYELCLKIRRQVLGDLHPETLNALANLAGLYRKQEQLQKAREETTLGLRLRR